jgi:POT family proton-dependent oligopeptide transporter
MQQSAPALDAIPQAVPRTFGPTGRFWLLAGAALAERFGMFGLRTMLLLYLVDATAGGPAWTQDAAVAAFGIFTAASVLSPLLGGLLADRVSGALGAARLGALVMFIGVLVVAVSSSVGVALGLGLMALGTGLVRPSLYALLAALRPGLVHRQDADFTLFLMPIELGAFLAPVVCGTLGALLGWSWAFGAPAAAMVLGLGLLVAYPNGALPGLELRTAGQSVVDARFGRGGQLVALLAVMGAFALVTSLASEVLLAPTPAESTTAMLIRGGAVTAFGFLLAPAFAWLWIQLGRQGRDLRTGTKLVLGMCLGSAGLLVAALGASIEAKPALDMALALGSGLLEGAALACLYPVVLSTLTRMAPSSSLAFTMALGTLLTVVLPPRLSALALELVPGLTGAIWWVAPAAALVLIVTTAVLGRWLEPRAAA